MEVIDIYKVIPDYMYAIYKITNPEGKIYVGSTVDLRKRFSAYRNLDCKSQIKLYNSFVKYGVENHKFEIICTLCSAVSLRTRELRYGLQYNVLDRHKGLNLLLPKEGELGGHSEETKQRISEVKKGTNVGADNPFYGKTYSEETRRIISEKGKGRKSSELQKKVVSEILKGNTYGAHLLLDTQTGIYYESIEEAMEVFNLSRSSMTRYLKGYRKNPTNLIKV